MRTYCEIVFTVVLTRLPTMTIIKQLDIQNLCTAQYVRAVEDLADVEEQKSSQEEKAQGFFKTGNQGFHQRS